MKNVKQEQEWWNRMSNLIGTTKWIRELLGNGAKYVHSSTVYKFMHPKHKIAPMTRRLRKLAGIGGMQTGIATGRLSRLVGNISTRTPAEPVHRIPYDHPAVKWKHDGFTIGEDYPEYTKYYENGWSQTFTRKQAIFLSYATENFGLMGMVGKTYTAPARPFNYLETSEVGRLGRVVSKTFELFFKQIGGIK